MCVSSAIIWVICSCVYVSMYVCVHRYPEGHLVKVLGPVNDLKVESDAVLIQAGIEYQVRDCVL